MGSANFYSSKKVPSHEGGALLVFVEQVAHGPKLLHLDSFCSLAFAYCVFDKKNPCPKNPKPQNENYQQLTEKGKLWSNYICQGGGVAHLTPKSKN